MRYILHPVRLLVASVVGVYAAAPSCQNLCDALPECANDPGYHGSYCKDWQTIPVCFGMYTRLDGTYCFQPNDPTCDDLLLPAVLCGSVIVTTTTIEPSTLIPTTPEPTTEGTTVLATTVEVTTVV